MSFCLVINLLLGLALLAVSGFYVAARANACYAVKPESDNHKPLHHQHTMQELIKDSRELQTLYNKLGYSAKLDRESKQIIIALKASIQTEIPDFAAFSQALSEIKTQTADSAAKSQYQISDDSLLGAVLAAENDQSQILELLNRNPVDEQLPFIERIPINKNGEIIWRTPLEHSLIRKRPANQAGFGKLLDQLETLFKAAKPPQGKQIQREVMEAIERTRSDLQKETAYLPTPLRAMEKKIEEFIQQSPSAASQTKIKQLNALLEELVALWNKMSSCSTLSEQDIADFKKTAQQQAKTYLESPWIHTPWLSKRLLATLLDSEVAALPKEAQPALGSPAAVLKAICDEVKLGNYDRDETIRRLQQQEERGLFVSSLVYPLLRLPGAPQTIIRKATT